MITYGSLFTGIGGFDLGFDAAGMRGVYQVERDRDCLRVLNSHFKNTEKITDVREARSLAAVDVLCGGFPCQDLSVAGKRKGLAGERSGLWFEFLRIVGESYPGIVTIENVPGLLSSHKGRDFAVIIEGLVKLGYCVAWRVLDAQYFGLAQRRKRVFIVASLGNGSCAEILFEPESLRRDNPPRREAGPEVANGTESGIEGNSIPAVAWALQERDSKGADSSTKEGHLLVANCFNGYTGGADDNDAQARYLVKAFRSTGNRGVYETGSQVGALTNTSDPNAQIIAQKFGVRRLTPTECERLQGFPVGWTSFDIDGKAISDSARYRMLGNAVAVPVAKWIGKRIAKVIGK